MGRLLFILNRLSQRLWFLPGLLSVAALLWIGLAFSIDRNLRWQPPFTIERETLMNLFTILSSTMLTVATFAVSAISSAIGGIATNATPRATRIVMENNRMRSTMAAFLATFIFAVVSITTLSATHFGDSGRLVLFAGFVILVGWVLIAFLQWVDDISNFGKPEDTIGRLYERAREIVGDPRVGRYLGGRGRARVGVVEHATAIHPGESGCVVHLDVACLQKLSEKHDGNLYVESRPGDVVHPRRALFYWRGPEMEEELKKELLEAVLVGHQDSASQNPRYAMRLLTEIADRALSPGVNDPGTAISVISRQVALLERYAANEQAADTHEVRFPRVHIPGIAVVDLFRDSFLPIARDGAGQIEVVVSLLEALKLLQSAPHPEFAAASAELIGETRALALHALVTDSQKKRVEDAAA